MFPNGDTYTAGDPHVRSSRSSAAQVADTIVAHQAPRELTRAFGAEPVVVSAVLAMRDEAGEDW
jgi:hypothetical protein